VDKPRLRSASTPGEVLLKVDHAGEHGAVSIYRAQRWVAGWRAPSMRAEVEEFIAHEQRHRALFSAELERRGVRRCRSYHLCGFGGLVLGLVTGLIGPRAIALTTEAVESVVLRHLQHQLATLSSTDPEAAAVIGQIVQDEQEHHDRSAARLSEPRVLDRLLAPAVRAATETVIWLGMWPKSHSR
jgi:ubiquinone biosynthesis monooxygenase Coq7